MKKFIKLFSLLSICSAIGLAVVLPSKNIGSVSAVDELNFDYSDTILYDSGTSFDTSLAPARTLFNADEVYEFNLTSVPVFSGFIYDTKIKYFEMGSYICSGVQMSFTRTQILGSSSYNFVLHIGYTLGNGGYNVSIPLNSTFYVVFSTGAEVDNLRSYVNLSTEKVVYKNTSDYYEALFNHIDSLQSEIDSLNSQITILESSNSSLRSELSEAYSELDTTLRQYNALSQSYDDLYDSYSDLLDDYNALILEDGQLYNAFLDVITEHYNYLYNTPMTNVSNLYDAITMTDTLLSVYQYRIINLNTTISSLQNTISSNQSVISNLQTSVRVLMEAITAYEEDIENLEATANVFGLIRSAFTGLVPLLDVELAPNITLGMLLTIPFVIAVIGFVIKLLG